MNYALVSILSKLTPKQPWLWK